MGQLIGKKLELGGLRTEASGICFTHALRDPGDMPRKDVRRNSISLCEVEGQKWSGNAGTGE